MQGCRKERKVHLVCRHPLSGQKVRYRMHTDPEGIVIKVEREDKTKSKTVWETLSLKNNPQDLEYLQSRAGKQAIIDTHVEAITEYLSSL